MRKEIADLLEADWGKLPEGVSGLVRAITALHPADNELDDLVGRLASCKDDHEAIVIMALMEDVPRKNFRQALIHAMQSRRTVSDVAARVLMNAKYEGAVDAVLDTPSALDALGDELPREMLPVVEELPQEKQGVLLDRFFHRMDEHPPLEAARPWLKMVSMILIQDKRLTPILWQTWQEMPRGQDWLYDRLALLDAMATHPDPIFKPAFEQAARSRDGEIKAIGRTGLHVLSEVAAGRWPFDKPAR